MKQDTRLGRGALKPNIHFRQSFKIIEAEQESEIFTDRPVILQAAFWNRLTRFSNL
jgi:hypothetical protein